MILEKKSENWVVTTQNISLDSRQQSVNWKKGIFEGRNYTFGENTPSTGKDIFSIFEERQLTKEHR